MIDGHFSIGEASRRTGLSVKAIRHYANEGIVRPTVVSDAGYRLYSAEDLWRLGLVRILRNLEFGLPEIRKVLERSLDLTAVVRMQRAALDMQIRRLDRARSLLDRVPESIWGQESLHHLSTVLEAMQMSREEREHWVTENWTSTMMAGAPDEWREAYLRQVRDVLPDELSAEQAKAWSELKELLSDPAYQADLRDVMRPFWSMVQSSSALPNVWAASMNALTERARLLYERDAPPEHPDLQAVVGDWIDLFAQALKMPATPDFVERFALYAETYATGPSRKIWDVMRRLNPERLQIDDGVQMLMVKGLRWRLAHSR